MEVKDFGINVTLIEPHSFKTDFFVSSAIESTPLDAYAKVTADFRAGDGLKPENIGDPNATVEALNPPLRLFLGKLLMSTDNTIAETTYQLGFENPLIFQDYLKRKQV